MNRLLKVSIIALCIVIILAVFFWILYTLYCEENMSSTEITFFTNTLKDIFNILFFCIVGTIGVLSYLQAKKTLFTPIKTETFKMQIKAFEEILNFFQSKSETEFMQEFDMDFIFNANAKLMFNDFINHFYKNEIKIKEEVIEEMSKNFAGGVASQSFAEKFFEKPDFYLKGDKQKKEEITNPAIILSEWQKYEYGMIQFTKKYSLALDDLSRLISSPLLPTELKSLIEEFESNVRSQLYTVGEVINELAKDLPSNCPNVETVSKIDLSGAWNLFNSKNKKLEPSADKVLKYIREYLKIDSLI